MSTLNGGVQHPLNGAETNDAFHIIQQVSDILGVGDIVTISGLVGQVKGAFNDPADGLLTGDSVEIHSFTSYLLVNIGKRDELEPGINVIGEGQELGQWGGAE